MKLRKLPFFFWMFFMWAVPSGCLAEDYEYIDIDSPSMRKLPIAIPYFKALTGAAQEADVALETATFLSDALVFTGYFDLLDRGAYLADPATMPIESPGISFSNWTGIGAELLVTGGVTMAEDGLQLELRLYDTVKGELVVGKRYNGKTTDQRRMAHRFASEIMYHLTGNRGMFGSRIAFINRNEKGHKEIYACSFDGDQPRPLTHDSNICLSPAWSADGKWIAYTSFKAGKPDLYIRHVTEKRGMVVAKKGSNISPAWLPGKHELSASLSYAGDPEIYLLTGTGKIIKQLTESRGIDISPSWSPDGSQMAFTSERQGSPQIYIKDMNTGTTRRITYEGKNNTQPSWSPQGNLIAYTQIQKNRIDVCVVNADGSGRRQLTRDNGDNEAPSWSPDGSMLAFTSTREGVPRIYVMTRYGTDQRRLLSLPGRQMDPAWSNNLED